MIDQIFDKIAVQLEYNGEMGSGVLLRIGTEDYSYLMSAGHCIFHDSIESNIEYQKVTIFRQINGNIQDYSINLISHIYCKESDLIVFKTEYIRDIPICMIANIERNDHIHIVGFPNALKGSQNKFKRYDLMGNLNMSPNDYHMQIDCNRSLSTLENTPYDNIAGYSGSGIYSIEHEELFLCGIVIELGNSSGVFDYVVGSKFCEVQANLQEKGWCLLNSLETCSFDAYRNKIGEYVDNALFAVCTSQMSEIRDNVTPKMIIEHCGKKLIWPYSERQLGRERIWESWLLYLMFRCIENKENLKEDNYYWICREYNSRKVKLIYSSKDNKLPEFLMDYCQNSFLDINENDFIIITTDKIPTQKYLNTEKITKIVTNVSSAICTNNEILIDVVEQIKNISIIHIRKILDELQEVIDNSEDDSPIALRDKLCVRIGELWNEY